MDGYCHQCRYFIKNEKYYGNDWWCTYHDKPADPNEFHWCCEE